MHIPYTSSIRGLFALMYKNPTFHLRPPLNNLKRRACALSLFRFLPSTAAATNVTKVRVFRTRNYYISNHTNAATGMRVVGAFSIYFFFLHPRSGNDKRAHKQLSDASMTSNGHFQAAGAQTTTTHPHQLALFRRPDLHRIVNCDRISA